MNDSFWRFWTSLLLVAILFLLMIALPVKLGDVDLRDIPVLLAALLALPFSYPLWSRAEIRALAAVYFVSVLATVIAATQYPTGVKEYLKSLIMLGLSHAVSYVIYTFVLSFDPQLLRRVTGTYAVVILSLCAIEVAVPPVATLSQAVTSQLYRSSALEDNSGDFHSMRDEALHGGFPRPLIGTQEPSFPAVSLAIALLLAAPLPARSRLGSLAVLSVATIVLRSPSFLVTYLSGLAGKLFARLDLKRAIGVAFLGLISLGLICAALWTRIQNVVEGTDYSFKTRIVISVMLVPTVFDRTQGLYGIGVIGSLHDHSSNRLSAFEEVWAEAIYRSDAEGLFWLAKNHSIPISFFPAVTHWAYLGVPLGLLSCYLWYSFYSVRQGRMAIAMFIFFFGFSMVYGGYTTIRLHAYTLLAAAAFVLNQQDAETLDEESENLSGELDAISELS